MPRSTTDPRPNLLHADRQYHGADRQPSHCKNASIRSALRYSCDNVFARMAVDMGNDGLASMAEAFGFNDDNLLMPVRVAPSNFPQHDRGPAELAAKGNGLAGITATPLEMARVMGVIANGGEELIRRW